MSPDEQKIRKTLQYLMDGIDNVDAELVNKAFHPNSQLFYNTNQGFMNVSIDEFCDSFEMILANPEHPFNKEKSQKSILYIDITKDVASAKIQWIYSDFMYTDYCNLLKISERWYIVNRVFSKEVLVSN